MDIELQITFMIIFAYLIGSLSSAVIVCKIFNLPDPRTEGSKSAGATNVLRLGNKKTAGIVMVSDILKGLLPTLLASVILPSLAIPYVALAAVFGHIYPIFYKFHGGKGVATTIGGLFAINVLLGLTTITVWLIIARLWRYSSLASIFAATLAPLFALTLLPNANYFLPIFFIMLLIILKHKQNIYRLRKGIEPKINFNKENLATSLQTDPEDEYEEYFEQCMQDLEEKKEAVLQEINDFKDQTLKEIAVEKQAALKSIKRKPAPKKPKKTIIKQAKTDSDEAQNKADSNTKKK